MFIVTYKEDLPDDIEVHFKENSRKQFNSDNYREVKVVKKVYSKERDNYYFSGAIYFKRKIKDFDYKIKNLTDVDVSPKDTFIGYELDFIIMKEPKIIIFFNRDETLFLGSAILSDVLFNKKDSFKPVSFDCTAIFKNKQKERITDIRFNGVRGNGKITAKGSGEQK